MKRIMNARALKILVSTNMLPLLLLLVLPAIAPPNSLSRPMMNPNHHHGMHPGPSYFVSVTIPSTINGYPVTSIGGGTPAFELNHQA